MVASKYYNLDSDVTLGGNNSSDYIISSQKANKTYIDNRIDGTSYSATNPLLTPEDGVCTWTVTHNLGTSNVICTLYSGSIQIATDVTIVSSNQVTISFMATSSVAAGTCTIVVLASGGAQGGGGSYVLPTASTETLGGVKIDGTSITIDSNGVISSTGGSPITVDDELSTSSTNPVQNKIITTALNGKQDASNLVTSVTSLSTDTQYPSAKLLYDSLFYKVGDTITLPQGVYFCPGVLTSSKRSIRFLIILPKSLANINTVTVSSLHLSIRYDGAYIPANDWDALTNATINTTLFSDNCLFVAADSDTLFQSYTNNISFTVQVQSFVATLS